MKITNQTSNGTESQVEVTGKNLGAEVIDLLQHDRMSDEALIRLHSRFEQIIESQIYLMLQRGVPAAKLASIIKKMDIQLKLESADEVLKAAGQ